MLGPSSYGFGHGAFGRTAFGHGTWPTFPFTPTYVYADEMTYAVDMVTFEDASEQRFLRSSDRGHALVYEWQYADSATVQGVASFWTAVGGPFQRFKACDHRTGLTYVTRFQEQEFSFTLAPAVLRQLPPLSLRVDRHITYAEEVMADSPVAWWRLQDSGTTTNTAADVFSANPAVVRFGVTFGATPGPLVGEPTSAISCDGASAYLSAGSVGLGVTAFTIEAWVQNNNSYFAARRQAIWCSASGGPIFCLNPGGFGGKLQAGISRGAVPTNVMTTGSLFSDTNWHHVVYAHYAVSSDTLWFDGAIQSAAQVAGANYADTVSCAIANDLTSTAMPFAGNIKDVALYPTGLSSSRIWAHYCAGLRF